MSNEYVGIYSDGTGGQWFIVRALRADLVAARYPKLKVFPVDDAPPRDAEYLERLRVFVAPGVDPLEPVRDRTPQQQKEFLAFRSQVLKEARQRRLVSQVPEDIRARTDRVPLWVDIENDGGLREYLESLPPPYDR